MKASRLLIAGTIAALSTAAFAQSPPPAQPPSEQQGTTFESLDANSDGKISKTEAAVNEAISAQFARYDKDGNGFIEKAEVTAPSTSPAEAPARP
jgi:Ca2+-binding EF-hand superfamily protein